MAVIKFETKDILMSKLLDAKWYQAAIVKIEGPTLAKSGGSYNYVYSFALTPEDNGALGGKEIREFFNTQMLGNMIPVVDAANGVKKRPDEDTAAFEADLDSLVGKKLDIKVIHDTYEGQLVNKIAGYAPYKSSTNAPAF